MCNFEVKLVVNIITPTLHKKYHFPKTLLNAQPKKTKSDNNHTN